MNAPTCSPTMWPESQDRRSFGLLPPKGVNPFHWILEKAEEARLRQVPQSDTPFADKLRKL